ncbi:hypothetical protein BT96DRAFT_1000371 [Gymnopus androsaceus JB14]|uniref:Endonuclease/exonuclease/phosphatase domain-containing protein n=1 Tax=Gymnopus androsaceus JB14 TaxID=1447944 RepID=A0A6A4H2K3_9AGAR|nr:hypothetical protein BT96DRAFT_1000371 [Gymnopus androsaceus JB14]
MVLDATPQDGCTTTYVHIYNNPSLGCQQILWRLRSLPLPLDQAVVITGDANIHHIRWLQGALRTSAITEEIVAWLDEHNFLLLNKKGTPTHFPHAIEKHPSVIDLTWSNVHATWNDTTCEWAINPNLSVGSNHVDIRWKLDSGLEEINNPLGMKYNMKDVLPKDWKDKFNEEIEKQMDMLQPLLHIGPAMTNDDLDAAANAFSDTMQAATAKVAPVQKPSPHAKPW